MGLAHCTIVVCDDFCLSSLLNRFAVFQLEVV